jgi:hypothetical protein
MVFAAGGWLAGVILGRERRRKRELARIVERARASLTAAFAAVRAQVRDKIQLYHSVLERHVGDRISVFVHDVEIQLERHDVPIAPDDARRLEAHEHAVRRTLAALQDASAELATEDAQHLAQHTSEEPP